MMRLAILALIVLLAGCADRTRLNPGADLAVYRASAAYMDALRPPTPTYAIPIIRGAYNHEDGSIYLREGMSRTQTALTFAHELAHAFDHQRPRDLWELLRRYNGRKPSDDSDGFDFNFHREHQ